MKISNSVVFLLAATIMSSMQNRIKDLSDCIKEHLGGTTLNSCELRGTNDFGCGLFATRDIQIDEILYEEKPLMLGPSGNLHAAICCVVCYKSIESDPKECLCSKKCGMVLCASNECYEKHKIECELLQTWHPKNPDEISSKRLKALVIIRGLFLSEKQSKFYNFMQKNYTNIKKDIYFECEFQQFPQDAKIINELRTLSAAVHTNAFMILYRAKDSINVNVRGFYPITGLMNHNCVPNTRHDVDEKFSFRISATRLIKKDEEIVTSYSQLLWSTNSRRMQNLISKQFLCRCKRCIDPTECGTNLSAIRCQNKACCGIVLPIESINFRSNVKCTVCATIYDNNRYLKVNEIAGSMVKSFLSSTFDLSKMTEFMESKLSIIVPDYSQFIIQLKLDAIFKIEPTTYQGISFYIIK